MLKNFDPLLIIIILDGVFVGVSALFLYAYFGTFATEAFEKYCDYLLESTWNEQSIEFQKCVLLMVYNTQQPQYYKGNDLFVLDLRCFAKVFSHILFVDI